MLTITPTLHLQEEQVTPYERDRSNAYQDMMGVNCTLMSIRMKIMQRNDRKRQSILKY